VTIAVELPTDRIHCWWEDAIIMTRLRFAASVCVLSTGLLIGSAGGGIAWADTDAGSEPSASSTSSQGAEGAAQGVTTASEPAKPVANPLETTLQNMRAVLGSLRKLANQQTPDQKSEQTESVVPSSKQDTEALGTATTDVIPAAPATTAVASDETAVATHSNLVPPVTNPLAPVATVVPPATNPLAPISTVVEPVTNAVARVVNVFASVPAGLMALPTSPTPITDVITLIQEMLTSATDVVVTLAQLPSNLYSMLASLPTETATSTVGGGVNPDASAPVVATRASQSLEVAPIFLAGGMALPVDIAPLETLGDIATTGLSNELPASGIATPARDVIAQSGLGSFLEHTVRALFVPASLSALAAVALPGVGGLLIICALGTRLGYRQAKALLEVRRAGIAVFAGPGPLGVVRAGSLIALRPRASGVRPDRALRVVRSETSRVVSLRDEAA
jgi:hypothetical protein